MSGGRIGAHDGGGFAPEAHSSPQDAAIGKRGLVQRQPGAGAAAPPATMPSRLHPPEPGLEAYAANAAADDPFALHQVSTLKARRRSGDDARPASASEIATHAIEHKSGGATVDAGVAARAGAQLGADVSGARVHDDPGSQAATAALGARAFAYGGDVFLGPGERGDDVELMAHELTHVSQQAAAGPAVQAKVEVGGANDPAEADADRVASAVAGGPAAGGTWLVDQAPAGPGQMTTAAFLAQVRATVMRTASAALGDGWSTADCPFIEKYLTRYAKESATELEALVRRFAPAASQCASAADVLPVIGERVAAGIQGWRATKALPVELAAIDPIGAASAAMAAMTGRGPEATEAATPAAMAKEVAPGAMAKAADGEAATPTLGGLRGELGSGTALDGETAARMGGVLGAQLDHVRVHTGAVAARKADEAGAAAFVVGGEVVLGDGVPAAGGPEHDALMAHELAHAVEQRDAALAPDADEAAIGDEETPAEERADAAAGSAVARLWSGAKRVARKAADLVKRPLAMQRCSTEPKTNTRYEYLTEHPLEIAQTAADHLKTLPFATHDAAVTWTDTGAATFAARVAERYRMETHPEATTALVRPDEIGHLIETSRPVVYDRDGQTNQGQRAYFDAVGITVGNALARRIDESLQREVPRYAQARYHGGTSTGGPTAEPALDRIVQSHPMDALVVGALVEGGVVRLNGVAFVEAHPDLASAAAAAPNRSRNVKLEPAGNPRWHRLLEPLDATPEEVATALTGSPTEAFRLEVAHPLYGLNDENGSATKALVGTVLRDEAALAQVGTLGKGEREPARILEAMRMNATMADTSVLVLAQRFGVSSGLPLLGAQITDRALRLADAGDAEVRKWDAHTEAQRVILQQVASGLSVCGIRLDSYSTGYGVDTQADPGAFGLPRGHRVALHECAQQWAEAGAASNLPTSADKLVQAAARRALTLDIEILESQLADPQAAAHEASQDETLTKDFDPAAMSKREVELRKRMGQARAQLLADPSKAGKEFAETGDEARDLNFESHLVQNAASLDSAWEALDDADGFWSAVTFDSAELGRMKSEGKRYYGRWVGIHKQFKDGKKAEARKAFEKLAIEKDFQSFLDRAQSLLKDVAKRQMIAKIIAMVVITVASMGAGAAVSGFVGGATVAEGVVVGGLAMGRTAGAIAGFVTEAAVFTLASNLAFSKDHSLTAVVGEFGKNLLLFGALRGVGLGVRAAGFGAMIKAGSVAGATTAAKLGKTAAQVFELVAMGEAGAFFAIVEGKVRAAIADKPMTQEEVDEIVKMTIIQTIVFAVVGRIAQSPLKTLQVKGAFAGQKFRLARAEAKALETMAGSMQSATDAEAALALVQRDRALIQRELELYQELLSAGGKDPKLLKDAGLTADGLAKQIKLLEGFAATSQGVELSLGMKQVTPNHFECPRAQIDAVMDAHRKSGAAVEKPGAPDANTGARTWTVTPKDGGGKVFITEQMPNWAITPAGKRVVAALGKAGQSDAAIFSRTDAESAALLEADRALTTGDAAAARRLLDRAPGLDAAAKDAIVKALGDAHALPEDVKAQHLKERGEIRWQMEKKNQNLVDEGKPPRYPDLDVAMNNAMANFATAQERGFPYGFESRAKFEEVGAMVKSEIQALASAAGKPIPTGNIAVQGSAVYRPQAGDIDVAVLATAAEFEAAVANAFPKEFRELRALGEDPMQVTISSAHNARQRTLANAIETGKLSRDRTAPSIRTVRDKIESMTGREADLSVIKIGSQFDRGPYIPFP